MKEHTVGGVKIGFEYNGKTIPPSLLALIGQYRFELENIAQLMTLFVTYLKTDENIIKGLGHFHDWLHEKSGPLIDIRESATKKRWLEELNGIIAVINENIEKETAKCSAESTTSNPFRRALFSTLDDKQATTTLDIFEFKFTYDSAKNSLCVETQFLGKSDPPAYFQNIVEFMAYYGAEGNPYHCYVYMMLFIIETELRNEMNKLSSVMGTQEKEFKERMIDQTHEAQNNLPRGTAICWGAELYIDEEYNFNLVKVLLSSGAQKGHDFVFSAFFMNVLKFLTDNWDFTQKDLFETTKVMVAQFHHQLSFSEFPEEVVQIMKECLKDGKNYLLSVNM